MRKIVLDKENRTKLRSLFGVSEKTISLALNFRSNTKLSQKIRAVALEYGGKGTGLEIETIFANGYVLQRYGKIVELRINLNTSVTTLLKGDEEVKTIRNPKVKDLLQLQEQAKRIAQSIY